MTARHQHFKIKIAVSGAAETAHCGEGSLETAQALGAEVARQGAILITGATTGIPFWAAKGAKEAGGVSIGISPAIGEDEHVEKFQLPLDYMDFIVYTGFGYSGRDLLLTNSADAVLFSCGRIGTVHEFTVAFESGKPVGVLEGAWPTADVFKMIVEKGNRPNPNIIYDRDPKNLVRRVIEMAGQSKKEYYKLSQ